MKSTLNKWIKISFVVFSFAVFLLSASNALASKTDNVFGWMWSDNIGWISLNNCVDPTSCSGPDYGVKINQTTNDVSGYGWSSNIGWISFNKNDWSDSKDICPPGGCFSGGNPFGINGWARALNGKYVPHSSDGRDNRGGYDGWISLGGSNYELAVDKTKDISSTVKGLSNKQIAHPLAGYGWGSNVIGWLQAESSYHNSYVVFDKTCDPMVDPSCPTPSNDLQIFINNKKSATIVSGDTVDIDWVAKNSFYPDECFGTNGGTTNPYPDKKWTNKNKINTYQLQKGTYTGINVPPTGTTTFRLTCTNDTKTETYYDEITVTSEFTASISPVSNSCIETTDPSPKFEWNTNDSSPDCVVEVSSFYGKFSPYTIPSSGSLKPSGKGPFNLTDTNFQYSDNAFYKLTCKNGTGQYETSSNSVTTFVKMCSNTSDYVITNDGQACNYVTEVKNSSPKIYKSQKVALSLVPNKFTADADVSLDTSRNTPVGKFNFSPSVFSFFGSKYNTVDTEWSLTSSELSDIINSTGFNGKNIQSIDIGVLGQSQNTTPKRETLYYCVVVPPKCSANSTDPDCIKAQCDPKVDPGCTPCDPTVDPFCIPTQTVKPKYKPF